MAKHALETKECTHDEGLDIDPCCGDCGDANATYVCLVCRKPLDREEWEYEHEVDWNEYLYSGRVKR